MGASASMQAASPARPAAPPRFVKPVQQNQQMRTVKLYRRPPQAHVGLGTIKIIKEYITKVMADVIAIPSSSEPLKKAIFDAAGEAVRTEYDNKLKTLLSRLIVLSPGSLKCKKLYLVAWQPDDERSKLEKSIQDFIHESIECAVSYHSTSIAFPAIGCNGNNSFTSICIPAIVTSIKNELNRIGAVMKVIIAILPTRQLIFDAFKGQLKQLEAAAVKPNPLRLPNYWTQSEDGQLRFQVPVGSKEYTDICTNFNVTMSGKYQQILMIERIQNKHWYLQYIIHSDAFREKLKTDTEKRLFHGCSEESSAQIINSFFNRSFAGRHGVVYGVGVYFSSQAAYSDRYATANLKREKRMFLSRVLIGKTTVGNSTTKVPPIGYDSTTDGNHIFVTYHDAQAYGEHLITYQ